MSDSASRRGKMYSCLHCEAEGETYIEARYRIIAHVYKHHKALDKAPFYCSFCLLRCTTRSALINHVSRYSRHKVLLKQFGQKDSSKFLVENRSPETLVLGIDFRELTDEESNATLPTSSAETDLDAGGEPETNSNLHLKANNNGLISVQITSEMLTRLLNNNNNNNNNNHNNNNMPVTHKTDQLTFDPYSPAPTAALPTYVPTPITEKTTNNSFVHPVLSPKPYAITTTPLQLTPSTNQPMPLPVSNFQALEPPLIARKVSLSTMKQPTSSGLSTPKLSSNYPTLNQLMDYGSSELDFNFNEDLLTDPPINPEPTIAAEKTDQAIQTNDLAQEPEPKKRRVDQQEAEPPAAMYQLIQTCVSQMMEAFEKNSRAIRGIDKTLATLADAVTRTNRTLERMGEEQRRENERRREEKKNEKKTDRIQEKNENYRPLKSVVNKK